MMFASRAHVLGLFAVPVVMLLCCPAALRADDAGGEPTAPDEGEPSERVAEAAEGEEADEGEATAEGEEAASAAEGDESEPVGEAVSPDPDGETARPEKEAEVGDSDDEEAFYEDIDEVTVRVFSVGTVDVERVDVEGRRIPVALTRAGHGTGFAVGTDGLVMTAQHVVDEARHVVVRLPDEGGFFPARVAYADEDKDIAILHVDAELPALEVLPEVPMRVRQTIFALGYPIDPSRVHPQSARGIVAGRYDDDTLQLDIALNPGNSGGPLLDEENRVLGMIVAASDVQRGVQGIGFAVDNGALSSALREAERRLSAGQVSVLGDQARLASVVVDELIQKGALHELQDVADLEEGLKSAELDRTLHDLTSRTDDGDLLAFMAGVLWNAALTIEVAGVRDIGEATLTESEASALARRLRSSSVAAAERAVEVDASVVQRSAFIEVALDSKGRNRVANYGEVIHSSSDDLDFNAYGGPTVRLNPTSSGVGRGVVFGFSLGLRELAIEDDWTIVPVLGGAFGIMGMASPSGAETFRHSFVSGELGLSASHGSRNKHWQLVAAYAPSRYGSVVTDDEAGFAAAENEAVWMHVRLAAGYRYRALYVGTAARILSGPTFWLQPLLVGLNWSY